MRLFHSFAAFLATLLVLAAINRTTLLHWKMQSDLFRFAQEVRRSDCSLTEKFGLLDRIDQVEHEVASGEIVGPIRWWRFDRAVTEMLEFGIEGDEVWLIERELRKVRRELGDVNQFVTGDTDYIPSRGFCRRLAVARALARS